MALGQPGHNTMASKYAVGNSKRISTAMYNVISSAVDQAGRGGSHPLIKMVSPVAQTIDQAKAVIKRGIKRSSPSESVTQSKRRRGVKKSKQSTKRQTSKRKRPGKKFVSKKSKKGSKTLKKSKKSSSKKVGGKRKKKKTTTKKQKTYIFS